MKNSPPLCSSSIDTTVNEALDMFNVPGAAVGIVIDGKVALTKGYGFRNAEKSLPVTENTLFAIGSCTKAFTSYMISQLVDEGKLTWDAPVIKHIPEFRLMDPYSTEHTTIRDLLAHRTGLARHDLLWSNPEFTRSDVIRVLQYLEPLCTLREKFEYNNLMYAVAGIIIERVTGQTYEDVLISKVFQPLGMLSSNCSVSDTEKSEDFSVPFISESETIPFRNVHACAPAGAINSNITDMVKWVKMQLSSNMQEMHTLQMPMDVSAPDDPVCTFGYGLGWCTGLYRGHYLVHHDGGIDGFIAKVALLPEDNVGIVVLTNSSSDGIFAASAITNTILDKLLNETDVDWFEKSKTLRTLFKQTPNEILESGTPAHPLEDYVGSYEHSAYGTLQVKLENNQLIATYGNLTAPLTCKCDNIFHGKMNEPLLANTTFLFSFKDDISELSIPMDQTVKPIIFKRK